MKRSYSGYYTNPKRYQKTKYTVNNLIDPDELYMPLRRNYYIREGGDSIQQKVFDIFGVEDGSDLSLYENWTEIAAKYKQVEFIKSELKLYYYDNQARWFDLSMGSWEGYLAQFAGCGTSVFAYKPYRAWVDENNDERVEKKIDNSSITSKLNIWEIASEQPGVITKIVKNGPGCGGQNMRKVKLKCNQSAFRDLRSKKTGFQINIDSIGTGQSFPQNRMMLDFMFDPSDLAVTRGDIEIYVSHTMWVKFKGRVN